MVYSSILKDMMQVQRWCSDAYEIYLFNIRFVCEELLDSSDDVIRVKASSVHQPLLVAYLSGMGLVEDDIDEGAPEY